MTYLLKFRALCYYCEKAEACWWCIQDQCALCQQCDDKIHSSNRISQRHERVEVVKSSVLSTLCNECNLVPASFYHQGRDVTLCELCERQETEGMKGNGGKMSGENQNGGVAPSIIPLQDAHVTDSIVFDKMDFTTTYAEKKRKSRTRLILAGLGAQESPESKVDRWLNNRSYAPTWNGPEVMPESKAPLPSNLSTLVAPENHRGNKRKLVPDSA